jgi:16S rRNA (uracil1498-N3)-methyltransferase
MLKHFYLAAPLAAGAMVALPAALQTRLSRVLRLGAGAEIALFNGQHGLWRAQLADAKAHHAQILEQLQPQPTAQGPTLAVGLPKREAWETIVRQATELGVAALQPLTTEFSQRDKFNTARATLLTIEAAEQCERLTLPTLLPLQPLGVWLNTLNAPCAWAYERGGTAPTRAGTVLVGPEGGFSPAEVATLQAHPQVHAFSLGPTILRADTAVVAALTRVGP